MISRRIRAYQELQPQILQVAGRSAAYLLENIKSECQSYQRRGTPLTYPVLHHDEVLVAVTRCELECYTPKQALEDIPPSNLAALGFSSILSRITLSNYSDNDERNGS